MSPRHNHNRSQPRGEGGHSGGAQADADGAQRLLQPPPPSHGGKSRSRSGGRRGGKGTDGDEAADDDSGNHRRQRKPSRSPGAAPTLPAPGGHDGGGRHHRRASPPQVIDDDNKGNRGHDSGDAMQQATTEAIKAPTVAPATGGELEPTPSTLAAGLGGAETVRFVSVRSRALVKAPVSELGQPTTPHVAVSHVWGKKRCKAAEVGVRGVTWEPVGISAGEVEFALAVAAEVGVDRVWIDSLCINQNSMDDKHGQMPHMGSIYETAKLVVVTCACHCEAAGAHRQRRQVTGQRAACAEQLEWCARVWCFQETVLPRTLACWMWDVWVWDLDVKIARLWASDKVTNAIAVVRKMRLGPAPAAAAAGEVAAQEEVNGDDSGESAVASGAGHRFQASTVLRESLGRACLLPQDHVFGVLGLHPGLTGVPVSYETPVEELILRYVAGQLRQGDASALLATIPAAAGWPYDAVAPANAVPFGEVCGLWSDGSWRLARDAVYGFAPMPRAELVRGLLDYNGGGSGGAGGCLLRLQGAWVESDADLRWEPLSGLPDGFDDAPAFAYVESGGSELSVYATTRLRAVVRQPRHVKVSARAADNSGGDEDIAAEATAAGVAPLPRTSELWREFREFDPAQRSRLLSLHPEGGQLFALAVGGDGQQQRLVVSVHAARAVQADRLRVLLPAVPAEGGQISALAGLAVEVVEGDGGSGCASRAGGDVAEAATDAVEVVEYVGSVVVVGCETGSRAIAEGRVDVAAAVAAAGAAGRRVSGVRLRACEVLLRL
ncbi:hypothetical protein HK405_010748 [Cladochytrium tenue]|nr:hypothetical protein HK405_010748 [Cladochytrium tenue]